METSISYMNMNMNKNNSIDKGCAKTSYISPEVKMFELTARNAILSVSNPGSTGEDVIPQYPSIW